jgi:hypothetical protein
MKLSRWLSAGLCALCQCTGGTETGNPAREDEDVQVAFGPLSSTVSRPGLGDVSFDSVAIQVASVTLEPCGEGASTVLLANRAVELLGAELSDARVPAGSYCAVIVQIGSDADSFAAGRMVADGKTRLTFESELRAEIRLRLREPLTTSGTQPSWLLGVDLAEWLDPIGAWLDSGDPQLTLDDPEALALRRAQARSLRLYEDVEGDGQLDPADVAAPLSESGILLRW